MVNPLSAADEHGLKGLSLDSQLRRAFFDLPASVIWRLAEAVPKAARARGLAYWRDGKEETINVLLRPTAVMTEQLNYYHTVSNVLLEALKRLPDMYLDNPEIRALLPLEPDHDALLRETWTDGHRNSHCVFGRLDAMADFVSPSWKDALEFVEPNLVGVGGITLVPGAERVVEEQVLPALLQVAPDLRIETGEDLRDLFLRELLDHLEAIGRPNGSMAFVDPKYSGDGPSELGLLAEYAQSQGIRAVYVDPTELSLKDGEVCHEGKQIDIVYRDYETRDWLDLAYEGGDPAVGRALFRRNQMVSSMAGDFDHKSAFEIFTDPRFARFFTVGERQLLRRHILWTRILSSRETTDTHGDTVDLPEFVRAHRDVLVIKPNRSYGGDRVLIGPSCTDAEWAAAIDTAVAEPGEWVTQKMARVAAYEFPVAQRDKSIGVEPFYVVFGFAPTKYGTGVLGRASQKQVVNVAQKGGLVVVLHGRH